MIALDARHYRPLRTRPPARPESLLVDAGEPAAFPASPTAGPLGTGRTRGFTTASVLVPVTPRDPALVPTGEARLLRRVRRVVRRRLRVDLAGLVHASISDGDLGLRIDMVSPRDPHLVEWTANRLVALVVLHEGCGARVLGGGGLMGRLELPSIACAGAFLAFCYDAEAGSAPVFGA